MSNMERGMLAAIGRFPHLGDEIRRRAFADPVFRALCDDLAEAQAAVERWRMQASGQARARSAEYEQLAAELAEEISAAILSPAASDMSHRSA